MTQTDYLKIELAKTKIAYQEALQISQIKAGFLGKIVHEIRSPLSTLMGLHQLVINDLCDNPQEEKESIREAYQYAKKLMAMIDRLVEVSKLEVGRINLEVKEFNLSELLEDIYNIIALEAANKNLKIQLENEAKNLIVITDNTRLTNIIFYLLEVVINLSEFGLITLNVSENKNDQECLIQIIFPCQEFSFQELEQINIQTMPVEELKKLHSLPEFSNQMKIMLAEALLEMLKGKLQLHKPDDEKQFMELHLSLPFEIG